MELLWDFPGSVYGQQYISRIQLIQAQLKKVGINVTLKSVDNAEFSANRKSKNFMINLAATDCGDDFDHDSMDYACYQSKAKNNYAGINEPGAGCASGGAAPRGRSWHSAFRSSGPSQNSSTIERSRWIFTSPCATRRGNRGSRTLLRIGGETACRLSTPGSRSKGPHVWKTQGNRSVPVLSASPGRSACSGAFPGDACSERFSAFTGDPGERSEAALLRCGGKRLPLQF